jgi:membrane associated rhomboid family serine protease
VDDDVSQRYRGYQSGPVFGLGGPIPPGVRIILIANAAAFAVFNVLLRTVLPDVWEWLALSSWGVLHGRIWQVATYMFLHGSFLHLFWNMFVVFMFGSAVEQAWGKTALLRYYFVTGIGSGLAWTAVQLGSPVPTVGASGAVYALLLAFAMIYPNSTILLFFVIPVKTKYFVAFLIGSAALFTTLNVQDGTAHLIHLAGPAIGWLYVTRRLDFGAITERYRRWRMRRRLSVIDYRELMKFDDEDDKPGGRNREV